MSEVPDKMPDELAHDPHYFVDAFLKALGETCARFDGAMSKAERLGALEMFKHNLIAAWREEDARDESE